MTQYHRRMQKKKELQLLLVNGGLKLHKRKCSCMLIRDTR